jgi:energy-coupling factor transporter ATP-binding protein EcfA2
MRARDNPFAADRVERIRYRFAETSLDELLARLDDMNYRAAIIGPEGSGKTTLLEDLRRVLEQKGPRTKLLFVNDASPLTDAECRRFLTELTPQDLVLLDGADAIRRSLWLQFRRHTIQHAAGLIVTSHRPGLLPTLIECTTTPALLQEIVYTLTPPTPALSPAFLIALHARHNGNLRACLRELYDLYTRDDCIKG